MAHQIPKSQTDSQPFKPERSPKYLAFLRKQHCICCGASPDFTRIEAAHTGPHGIGIKASDFDAVPLCHGCHQSAKDSYHRIGEKAWLKRHGFSLEEIRSALRKRYERPSPPALMLFGGGGYDPIPF